MSVYPLKSIGAMWLAVSTTLCVPHFAHAQSAPTFSPMTSQAPGIELISTPAQAGAILDSDAPIIFLGDNHNDDAGIAGQAMVALIPYLGKVGVSVLALEKPPQLTPFFTLLQRDIRYQHLDQAQVAMRIQKAYDGLILDDGYAYSERSGMAGINSLAAIIMAATNTRINVVGADARFTQDKFQTNYDWISEQGDAMAVGQYGLSEDKAIADGIFNLMKPTYFGWWNKPTKIAIMFGADHGCTHNATNPQDHKPHLIEYLRAKYKVITIELNPADVIPTDFCAVPIKLGVDVQSLMKGMQGPG